MRLFEKQEEVKAIPAALPNVLAPVPINAPALAPVDNSVPYQRLQITSSTREFQNETAEFLFDES